MRSDQFTLEHVERSQISSQVTMKSKLGSKRFFSFSSLLLGGFLVVLIPLLGGIFNISYQLDRIAADGLRTIQVTEEVTLLSRQMEEAVLSLQRASGQYFVLEDPALLERPSVLVLTKCDLIESGGLDSSLMNIHDKTVPISAVKQSGLNHLLEFVQKALKQTGAGK